MTEAIRCEYNRLEAALLGEFGPNGWSMSVRYPRKGTEVKSGNRATDAKEPRAQEPPRHVHCELFRRSGRMPPTRTDF